jgi:hypothetical protein
MKELFKTVKQVSPVGGGFNPPTYKFKIQAIPSEEDMCVIRKFEGFTDFFKFQEILASLYTEMQNFKNPILYFEFNDEWQKRIIKVEEKRNKKIYHLLREKQPFFKENTFTGKYEL